MQAMIGKTIDSWCGRCKLMLAHTIEAVVNQRITRTHCNTCGAQHAYRRNPPGTSTAKDRTRSSADGRGRPTRTSAKSVDYAALLRGKDLSKARDYKVSEHFEPDEVIKHPTFGLGLVVRLRDSNKIDVGFSDGVKTLTHAVSA